MKIAVAGDHAGYELKQWLVAELRKLGHEVSDLGTDSQVPVDYPDFARAVGAAVVAGSVERGVVVCGSGVGACIAANKIRGVRAGMCHDTYSAHQGVEHDAMNVLCLGSRVIGCSLALEIVLAFLSARPSSEERHLRRVRKILEIEANVLLQEERSSMNNHQLLDRLGQSIWYDSISRSLIRSGELQRMVNEGLLGVTSNPTIFDKAISGSTDYEAQIRELLGSSPAPGIPELIQSLMVTDIQMATDVFRPVYDRTRGRDGYVSIEVTPSKARNTQATIEEVRVLWKRAARPNMMIKIPATREGLPAIEQAVAEGININITLIFSVARYREVVGAYLRGLERRAGDGRPLSGVVSVASVFVSRVDTLVDGLLLKKAAAAAGKESERYRALMGTAAVANAKMVYVAFQELFSGDRFRRLASLGAAVQRPLWGSTSTKNPAYDDLLYVNPLIGKDTVNTVPPATYTAILDHGKPELSVEAGIPEARKVLADLAAAGIDMDRVMQQLEEDGVAAFEKSFDGLARFLSSRTGAR